jgi:hypothetical protein
VTDHERGGEDRHRAHERDDARAAVFARRDHSEARVQARCRDFSAEFA